MATRIIAPRSNRVDVSFLYYALCNLPLKNLGYSRHYKLLKEQVVRFPEGLPEQRKIAAILSSVDDVIEKTQAVIDQVQVVKRGLMQELLTRGLPGRHTRVKQTEVGAIPEEWEVRTLADLATYHNGRAFKPTDWTDTGLPIIRIAQITNPDAEPNRYDGDDVDRSHHVANGDLLFSWSATLAVVKWDRGPAILNQHIFKVVEMGGVQRDFLQYLLDNALAELAEQSHGSTMKHIRKGVLREHRVAVPPLAEQAAIAATLCAMDDLIRTAQASVEQMEDTKSALMSALLTGELRVTPDTEAA